MAALAPFLPALLPLALKFLKNGGFKSKGYSKLNQKATKRGPIAKRAKGRKKNTVSRRKTGKSKSRKRSQLTSNGGGAASSMPAPVAFARNGEIKASLSTLKSDYANGTKVHSVDFVGPLTVSSTGATVIGSVTINPTNASTFPWMSGTIAAGYEKYKLLMLRMHYVHFCPTSYQGTIMMMYNSDSLFATPSTESQMQNDSNATEGAIYEDVFLDVDLTGLSQDWFFVGVGAVDTRFNTSGQLFIGTANVPTSNTYGNIGNYYVEAIWQFVERKLPSQTEPVSILRQICSLDVAIAMKRKLLHQLVDSIPLSDKDTAQKKLKTEEEVISESLKRLQLKTA